MEVIFKYRNARFGRTKKIGPLQVAYKPDPDKAGLENNADECLFWLVSVFNADFTEAVWADVSWQGKWPDIQTRLIEVAKEINEQRKANSWAEIKNGRGLVELPILLQKEAVCCMCMRRTKCKLYTDQRLPDAAGLQKYQDQVRELLHGGRIWCKDHALNYFKEE